MAISEWRYLRTGDAGYLELSKRWAKGTAILFAIGAVSGTVLSFELGLLWPGFMSYAGAIIGMPFSLEGFAFFVEAIFLGIYLYGWNKLSARLHWITGVIVAIAGISSGMFVITTNAWMNSPAGFDIIDGKPANIEPLAAMLNPSSLHQVLHMTFAAYVATGFVVAAIHAFFLLRNRKNQFHLRAFTIALIVACVSIPLQLLSGDLASRKVAELQPAKFAAMEAHYKTMDGAPLILGGIPNDATQEVDYGIEIPHLLSLMIHNDINAEVKGLDVIPSDQRPNTLLTHISFDIMVACGMIMLALVLWAGWLWWRRKAVPLDTWLLRAFVAAGPLGFIAIETGWMVTELGRQPWIIYGVMRTSEAVTPVPGLIAPFVAFTTLYIFLSVIMVFLLRRTFLDVPVKEKAGPNALEVGHAHHT